MSCLMYKKGNSAVVRGVVCDFVRIPYGKIEEYKAKGYVSSLAELTVVEELTPSQEIDEPMSDIVKRIYQGEEFVTKDELVAFAAENLDMKLSKRMLEKNMIEKIKEALE